MTQVAPKDLLRLKGSDVSGSAFSGFFRGAEEVDREMQPTEEWRYSGYVHIGVIL